MVVDLLLIPLLIYASDTDIKARTISNAAVLGIAALGLVSMAMRGYLSLTVIAFRLLPALLLFVAAVFEAGCGGGDVKLFTALCLFCEPLESLLMLLIAFVVALTIGKCFNCRSLPFAPFLCGSFLLLLIIREGDVLLAI